MASTSITTLSSSLPAPELPWTLFSEENAVKAYLAGWAIFWAVVLILTLLRWGFSPVITLLSSAFAACGRIANKTFGENAAIGFLAIFLFLGFAVAPLILYAGIPVVGYQLGKASISLPLLIVDERKDELEFGLLGRFKDEVPPTNIWHSQPVSWFEWLTVNGICRLGLMPADCTPWLQSTAESRANLHIVNMLVTDLALRELGACNEPRHAGSRTCVQEPETRQHGWFYRTEFSSKLLPDILKKEAGIRQRESINPERVYFQLNWRTGARHEFESMKGLRYGGWINLIGIIAAAATLVLVCGIIAGSRQKQGP